MDLYGYFVSMLPQGSDIHSSPWDSPRFERGRDIPEICHALQHCMRVEAAKRINLVRVLDGTVASPML